MFLSELKVEDVNDKSNEGRGLWRLTAPLVYYTPEFDRTLVVPEGFETDFASVPRVPIAFLLCGDTAHPAAALHDWLYTAPHPVRFRQWADEILREAALSEGVPAWRAAMLYYGVRLGGESHWRRS